MKKLLVVAFAAIGLAACSGENVVELNKTNAITFANVHVDHALRTTTRATIDPSFDRDNLQEFKVWAFMDTPSGIVLNDELVEKRENEVWFYTHTQYWLPNHTYYFAALAPVTNHNWTLSTAGANTYGIGSIHFENVDGGEDLIYAAQAVETPKTLEELTTDGMDAVDLIFGHLLSKAKFTFKNGFYNETAKIQVKNITMTVPAKGDINLAVENWWDTNSWVLDGNDTTTLEFGNVSTVLEIGKSETSDKERLTIPAGADYTYNIEFDVELYMNDELAHTFHRTATVSNRALEIGKAYNFSAVITPENLELKPIEFTVTRVKGWVVDGEDVAIEQ